MISRSLPIRALAILALANACPVARADDVGVQLGRLSSASGAERADAQRWLSAHLRLDDSAAIAAAARAGSAEVRARLVEALAEEDRLVGLSAALAASRETDSAALGREALIEAVERWSPGSKKAGLGQPALFEALRKQHDRTILVDAELCASPLEHVLDLLESGLFEDGEGSSVERAPRIAIDPRCAPAQPKLRAVDGRLDSLLSEIVTRRGLMCRGFGFGEDVPPGAARWIVVLPRDTDADESPARLLAQWTVAVAGSGDDATRAAAARALAASGWPAAVAWLADRWSTQDDAAALEGVLLAARRERVAPVLLQPAMQERLRESVKRALASGAGDGARAIAIATALGATGTIGSRGENLLAPALNGLADLAGRALHVRLVELEQRQPVGLDAVIALGAVLGRANVEPASAWLALGMLSRAGGTPEAISPDLVVWCTTRDHLDELGRLVRGQPSFPPAAWHDPQGLPAASDPRVRALVASAWLARGDVAAAARHVESAIQAGDPRANEPFALALLAAAKDLGAESVEILFERVIAHAAGEPGATLRTAAIAGAARSDELAARVLAAVPEPAVSRADALALAALAGGPRGGEARTRLLAALRGTLEPDHALAAADRALAELRATRDEPLERAFTREARTAAREGRPELRARMRIDSWPVLPPGEPLRLGDLDRSFERAGVP